MAEEFYTILTNVGKAKIANATALESKVNLKYFALGDGNGNYYEPTENQDSLRHEVWRGNINNISIDSDNDNWVVVEVVIPADVGGFTIREAGIFDSDNNLLAIGKYPETYKPELSSGSGKDLYIRMILEVSNSSVVTLKIDPSVVLVTKKDLDNHLNNEMPHRFKDHKNNKVYKFGFQVNSEGKPEIIYEEVM